MIAIVFGPAANTFEVLVSTRKEFFVFPRKHISVSSIISKIVCNPLGRAYYSALYITAVVRPVTISLTNVGSETRLQRHCRISNYYSRKNVGPNNVLANSDDAYEVITCIG